MTPVRTLACLTILLELVFASVTLAQDPRWLRHWREAQKTRPAEPPFEARIAPEGEEGTPLIIEGVVFDPTGHPQSGVVVHAYHRDARGFDFGEDDETTATWRLQAFAKTNARGEFRFLTIRPAPDHLGREAAHVHLTIDSEKYGRQWAPTVYFADDPRITREQLRQSRELGEFGNVLGVELKEGVEVLRVRIRLAREPDF